MPSLPPRRARPRAALPLVLVLAGAFLSAGPAARAAGMRLVDFGKLGVESQISVNGSAEVATQLVEDPRGKSLEVRCTPGKNPAPGVILRPGDALNWNLAGYGAVEADVTNLSDAPLVIHLRVDNPADGTEARSNVEKVTLPVGKSGTVRVFFGYSMGEKAFALDPAKVSKVVLFTAEPARGSATFRVTALRAVGKPGDKPAGGSPADAATRPAPDGAVVRFDGSLSAAQAEAHGGRFMLPPSGQPGPALITFEPGSNPRPSVVFKVAAGARLDLSGYRQVEFTFKNTYALSVHVFCRVENAPGADGKPVAASAEATLEPGASKVVAVPLAATDGGFARDKVTAFAVVADADGKERKLALMSIKAADGKSPAPTPTPTTSPTPNAPSKPTASPTPTAAPTPNTAKAKASPGPGASPTPVEWPTDPVAPSPTPGPSLSPRKSDGPGATPKA